MFVAVKNKREMKYIDAGDVEINGEITLKDLYERFLSLQEGLKQLTKLLEKNSFVQSDKEYIAEVDGKLTKIQNLKLYDVPQGTIHLQLYEIKDGKLVVNKNKLGGVV